MQSIVTRNVTELPAHDRQALENVLGASLDGDQQVFIMAYRPGSEPDEATRAAARRSLDRTLAATQEFAGRAGVTAAEADAAVEEAMEHVRRRES